ncbi:glycosyl hydrolase 115 family protein [Sphingobacterium suaedae]|uniref:Glycosyl hydrolase 115 family protein n=1 Tax=Sphingobacterium suaedae TaxID=1686402 RepID=A0ABW5KGS9_9SPHI
MKTILFFITLFMFSFTSLLADVTFRAKEGMTVAIAANAAPVVQTALAIFKSDFEQVFGATIIVQEQAVIHIGTLEDPREWINTLDPQSLEKLRTRAEGFLIEVHGDKMYILGSDKRGTAYGILELSRLMGVSPWEWWADATIAPKTSLKLPNGYRIQKHPSVKHRGIFINDEDWGLMPWSSTTYEPSNRKGQIGPKTYSRVFELLLRLRANTLWPAMHEVSIPFYFTPGNKEAADRYGILLGTSHCEPLMRNSANEWDVAGKGAYNYVTNKEEILTYWAERLEELKGSDNIFTIGLRGKHDGMMQGVKTLAEHKAVLSQVLPDQRALLEKHIHPDVTKIPQVFIPYKEVLDVYHDGLAVPDDVTLVWCDDNYGYIKHFPNEKERNRKGGNGIYYHVSYWGRPHDYLWLATNHPAQLYTQMKLAYDKGARDIWILNVGDIKPAEYLIELFLDMAWDIDGIENNENGLNAHLQTWLTREFGKKQARMLLPILQEYYRLAYIRKPEFMGNTRTEEQDPMYKQIKDLPWSEERIRQRIQAYERLTKRVDELTPEIPVSKQDAWFQLIEYPVKGAAEMNKKQLYGQLARHEMVPWELSDQAYENILALTNRYNTLANGKWNRMMNDKPRNLEVFQKVPRSKASAPLHTDRNTLTVLNGKDYKRFMGAKPISYGLGYDRGAVSIPKGSSLLFEVPASASDSILIELALAPNHEVDGSTLRYGISVNDSPEQAIDFRTEGRSEEWKMNVLRNQAIRQTGHRIHPETTTNIRITALDEGVVLDQIHVFSVE